MNAEDGGNRRFICVQLPEETPEDSEARKAGYFNIADIAKERIRRAGEKAMKDNSDKLKDRTTPLDVGFKAFALDSSNLNEWDSETDDLQAALELQVNSLKAGRSHEDVLYEVLLRYGMDIAATPIIQKTLGGKEVFDVDDGRLLVCLETNVGQGTVEAMAKAKPVGVVFRDDGFKDDIVKLNAEETLKNAGMKKENIRVI
jgi:adenine-specific DNA-methyltransferase